MHRPRIGVAPLGMFAVCAFSAAIASGLVANPAQGESGDDRAVAEALVSRLDGDGTSAEGGVVKRAGVPSDASVIGDALRRAKAALERATGFRNAGETARARLADGVAREWAETARDLASAVDAEASAAQLRRNAVEAQAKLERSRVLVEEAIARAGRLGAQLQASDEGKRGKATP